jgi:outer membrane immunogenic protein
MVCFVLLESLEFARPTIRSAKSCPTHVTIMAVNVAHLQQLIPRNALKQKEHNRVLSRHLFTICLFSGLLRYSQQSNINESLNDGALEVTILTRTAFLAVAFSTGLLLSTATVHSADVIADPAYDWNGAYIGAVIGYGFGETAFEEPAANAISDKADFDGFNGGLTIGYNHQTASNLVIGLELDGSFSGIEGTSTSSASFNCGPLGCDVENKWLGTGRLRAGYAVDNFMPYVTGGIAFGKVEGVAPSFPASKNSDTMVGWTIGAGMEYGVSESLSIKAEALYVDLGRLDIPSCPNPCHTDVDFVTVRAGLNWSF